MSSLSSTEHLIQAGKAALRTRIRERLRQLPHAERDAASRAVCQRLGQQAVWTSAKSVLLFAPMPAELDIWPLVQEGLAFGKTVALPRFSPTTQDYSAAVVRNLATDLHAGQLGIREPTADCQGISRVQLDLVLVPGVGFDPRGSRLGRGRGYYDRLLAGVPGVKCGVAFDQQVVEAVPVEPHDVRLDYLVTPTRWLECSVAGLVG